MYCPMVDLSERVFSVRVSNAGQSGLSLSSMSNPGRNSGHGAILLRLVHATRIGLAAFCAR